MFRKTIILFALLLIICAGCNIEVTARSDGFSVEELSEDSKKSILGNIDLWVLAEEPSQIMSFRSFDVNSEGDVVIGSQMFTRANVCVYDSAGNYKCGFAFNEQGTFGVAFNGNCINIYKVRSKLVITVDLCGNVVNMYRIQKSIENDRYWSDNVWVKKRVIGSTEYVARNDKGLFNIFSSTYTRLISKPSDDKEIIIYDANMPQLLLDVLLLILILGITTVGAIAIKKEFKTPSAIEA